MKTARGIIIVVVFAAVSGGCATVKPWQREIHARRVMQPNPDPVEDGLDDHVQEYREGSAGGAGVGGGGCGCN